MSIICQLDISKKTKKRWKKGLVKGVETFLKKKKTKSENMVANYIKTFLKMKNEGWLSLGKIT